MTELYQCIKNLTTAIKNDNSDEVLMIMGTNKYHSTNLIEIFQQCIDCNAINTFETVYETYNYDNRFDDSIISYSHLKNNEQFLNCIIEKADPLVVISFAIYSDDVKYLKNIIDKFTIMYSKKSTDKFLYTILKRDKSNETTMNNCHQYIEKTIKIEK